MKEKVGLLSLIVNLFLTVIKLAVGFITNSYAIIAEGVHSGADIISSFISYVGIKQAKKPRDKEHPYGYYKSETIAGFIITIILLLTSLGIIYKAIYTFFYPEIVVLNWLAFGVMMISVVLNAIMSELKLKYGKKYDCIALITDGIHSKVDVLTSLGVLLGLAITKYWIHTDSLLALFIGIYLLKQSINLYKKTNSALMGESANKKTEEKIRQIVKKQGVDLVDLKTQKLGSVIFAELTIKLNSNLSVEKANKITKNIKESLEKNIQSVKYIVIQIQSHKIKQSFYNSNIEKLDWKGKYSGLGLGPKGDCVCPKCNYKIKHKKNIPCRELICPKCKITMKREKIN